MIKQNIFFALFLSTAVMAHEWYPPECCSGNDCRLARQDEIVEAPGGWRVVPTGEFFTYKAARPSPDGKFHRCLQVPVDIKSKTLCIFVPVGGS